MTTYMIPSTSIAIFNNGWGCFFQSSTKIRLKNNGNITVIEINGSNPILIPMSSRYIKSPMNKPISLET
jgi:hypothetical protein